MKKQAKTNRRKFVKKMIGATTSAFAAPYLVPSSALGLAGNVAPGNRITLGVIGTGNQGFQDMKGFLQNDDLQIVAVCDVNKGSRGYKTSNRLLGREPARDMVNKFYAEKTPSGTFKGCDAYVDFRNIIERPDIDAVLVVTPDHWHAIPVIMAAKAGKDVYCEKPLSLTIAEGRAMVNEVKRSGIVLQMGTHHRSVDAHLRFCCELIRNGRIGKLQKITTVLGWHSVRKPVMDCAPMPVPPELDYDMWLGPAPWAEYHYYRCLYTFRYFRAYAGGEPTNNGVHAYDICQWAANTELTGPVEVEDLGGEFLGDECLYDGVGKVHFRARFANGVEFECVPGGNYLPGLVGRFEGSDGWIEASWSKLKAHPDSLLNTKFGPNEERLFVSPGHYRNFIDCVKSRTEPICPVEVGHRSTSISHLGNIAMELKRKLQWDPDNERFIDDDKANQLLSRPMRAPWRL